MSISLPEVVITSPVFSDLEILYESLKDDRLLGMNILLHKLTPSQNLPPHSLHVFWCHMRPQRLVSPASPFTERMGLAGETTQRLHVTW